MMMMIIDDENKIRWLYKLMRIDDDNGDVDDDDDDNDNRLWW
jgi:hypothetical protein